MHTAVTKPLKPISFNKSVDLNRGVGKDPRNSVICSHKTTYTFHFIKAVVFHRDAVAPLGTTKSRH
jgi:hypothetical protein